MDNGENLSQTYLTETYDKLLLLGQNQEKTTWLVADKNTKKLAVWKEISTELIPVYQQLHEISHPCLAPIQAIFTTETGGIVLEDYISGNTLETILSHGPIPAKHATIYMEQLLSLLDKLEEMQIVHRDINPKNIIISSDGVAKLIDFGIARQRKTQQQNDTSILGTVGYAAPEQFGFLQTDTRTDIYACGILFHVMLTGHLPQGMHLDTTNYNKFISKCIAMDPNKRFSSVKAALTALVPSSRRRNITKEKTPRQNYWVPLGLKSPHIVSRIFAYLTYGLLGLYFLGSIMECAKTPTSFFLELLALLCYIVLVFILATNYGNWYNSLPVFKNIPGTIKMTIRVILCLLLLCYGFTLEQYVRVTLLGIATTT